MPTLKDLIQRDDLDRQIVRELQPDRAHAVARVKPLLDKDGLAPADSMEPPWVPGCAKPIPHKYRINLPAKLGMILRFNRSSLEMPSKMELRSITSSCR